MPERNSDRDYDLMVHDGFAEDIDSADLHSSAEDEDELSTDEAEEELPVIAEVWTVHAVTVPSGDNSQYCSRRRQHEYEATRHDSCRSALRDATWNWVERSGHLATGDSVRVTDPNHAAFDYCGEVLDYDIANHVAKVKLVEVVDGRQIGEIHRTMITKIHGTTNNSIARDPEGVQNMMYLANFVHEASLEIDRVSRFAFTTRDSGSDRDQSGRRVFIGDLVHIIDDAHDYNGWVVMVSGIKPGGMLRCSLGMPPRRQRTSEESDERARWERPLDRNCLVRVQRCKVWGPNP